MRYKGSKLRYRKQILEAMTAKLAPLDLSTYSYWEPFVGGGNMIGYVNSQGLFKQCHGTDIDPDVIAYLAATAAGWMPPDNISPELHKAVKANPADHDPALIGYMAFAMSFGGMKFAAYCKDKRGRDYALEAYRRHLKDSKALMGATFSTMSYLDAIIPGDGVIYCDPPYVGTSGYGTGWDQDAYVEWLSQLNQPVFMSAYENPLPDLATEIWAKPAFSRMNNYAEGKTDLPVERLFYKS